MKDNLKRIRTLAIILLIVILAIIAISGTYAKYTNTFSDSDSARVAHWTINSNNKVSDLFASSYTNVADGTDEKGIIAPGTSGTYKFDVTGDVETAYVLNINATGTDGINDTVVSGYSPIKYAFSSGDVDADSLTYDLTFDQLLSKINSIDDGSVHSAGAVNTGTYTIGWKWAFEGNDDSKDTQIGNAVASNEAKVSLNVAVTATQVD